MILNRVIELSMTLDTDQFQKIVSSKAAQLDDVEDGYIDLSMAPKGITVIYRNSKYKKKIQLLVNTSLTVDNLSNVDKLLRKLNKRITEYFERNYRLDNFTLSGMNLSVDINVGSHGRVADYMKVLRRVGKVKGFSPISYDNIDEKCSFCLSGNSNATDFLLYDLECAVTGQLRSAGAGQKQLQSVSEQTKGILRTEVRLTKPKAIRAYTDSDSVSGQIMELSENREEIFLDTFGRVIPFGDFHKKDTAVEIVRSEVKDSSMRKKMLRLLALIPEKKSLHLAQKAMNCRDVEKVMDVFAKISLSPVTISKRHDVKKLKNLYSYL